MFFNFLRVFFYWKSKNFQTCTTMAVRSNVFMVLNTELVQSFIEILHFWAEKHVFELNYPKF